MRNKRDDLEPFLGAPQWRRYSRIEHKYFIGHWKRHETIHRPSRNSSRAVYRAVGIPFTRTAVSFVGFYRVDGAPISRCISYATDYESSRLRFLSASLMRTGGTNSSNLSFIRYRSPDRVLYPRDLHLRCALCIDVSVASPRCSEKQLPRWWFRIHEIFLSWSEWEAFSKGRATLQKFNRHADSCRLINLICLDREESRKSCDRKFGGESVEMSARNCFRFMPGLWGKCFRFWN